MTKVLPKPPRHFYRTNNVGLLEAVDVATGRVLAVQSSPYDFLENKFDRLVEIKTPEGPVFIEKGLSFDHTKKSYTQEYSSALADLICEKIVNGYTVVEAAKEYGVDYASICRWRREKEEFRVAVAQATKDRAENFHDQAIMEARSVNSGDKKLEVETLKWAAERGDPDKFGNKTTLRGDKDAPITWVIDTGIRRKGDPGFEEPKEKFPEEEKSEIITLEKGEYEVE
jgi:transposase-like protein